MNRMSDFSSSEIPNSSDCISRQAAIDAIYAVINPDASWVAKSILGNIERLPSAQPEQRWIPCSERLPEEEDAGILLKKLGIKKNSDYVIATVEVKGKRMTVTACTHDGAWYWKMRNAFPDFKVTAWMPLPKPYAERREG